MDDRPHRMFQPVRFCRATNPPKKQPPFRGVCHEHHAVADLHNPLSDDSAHRHNGCMLRTLVRILAFDADAVTAPVLIILI